MSRRAAATQLPFSTLNRVFSPARQNRISKSVHDLLLPELTALREKASLVRTGRSAIRYPDPDNSTMRTTVQRNVADRQLCPFLCVHHIGLTSSAPSFPISLTAGPTGNHSTASAGTAALRVRSSAASADVAGSNHPRAASSSNTSQHVERGCNGARA